MKRALEDDPPSPSLAYGTPAPPPPQPQVVNNHANTIHNYFAAAPPPAAADDARPAHLFATNAERRHKTTVVKNGKPCSMYISDACRDGTLRGGCRNTCKNTWVGIEWFAPADDSWQTAAKRDKFFEAYGAYQQAYKDGDKADAEKWRAVVEDLRTKFCDTCMERLHPSPAIQACKDEWERMRREACARNGGCQNQHCPERGDDAWCVLEADHGTNPKMKNAEGTPVNLSKYTWWSGNGGVAAMRKEAQQIHQWICGCCHALEPTSNSGKRCADPATMPPGAARSKATIKYPKQQHVDKRKRDVGACAHCRRAVVAGQEQAFDWDHRVEATKCKGGVYGKNGGVGGLVSNSTQAAALEEVRELLDAEMDKCDLLCHNCHHRKTHGYPRRAPVA